jgi:hypothetical protein
MRGYPQVAHARIGRQDDGQRRRLAPGARPLVEQMGDRGGVDGAARQRGGQGGVERGCSQLASRSR